MWDLRSRCDLQELNLLPCVGNADGGAKTALAAHPHYSSWLTLAALVQDGIAFTRTGGGGSPRSTEDRRSGGYSPVGDADSRGRGDRDGVVGISSRSSTKKKSRGSSSSSRSSSKDKSKSSKSAKEKNSPKSSAKSSSDAAKADQVRLKALSSRFKNIFS